MENINLFSDGCDCSDLPKEIHKFFYVVFATKELPEKRSGCFS